MGQVLVETPVTCPVCRTESLTHLPVEDVVDALEKGQPILLTAECHDRSWTALAPDLNRIRRHLASIMSFTGSAQPWMDGRSNSPTQEHSSWHLDHRRPYRVQARRAR